MKQCELNRAVARATGESVGFIESLGFSEVRVPSHHGHPTRKARRLSVRAWYRRPRSIQQLVAA